MSLNQQKLAVVIIFLNEVLLSFLFIQLLFSFPRALSHSQRGALLLKEFPVCLGLKDRCLPRKVGTYLGKESVTPFPQNYSNSKIMGLSGKYMGKGITVL